jgi:tetratricopeptide (TPR) repeat protein
MDGGQGGGAGAAAGTGRGRTATGAVLGAAVLAALVLAVFWPAVRGEFLWDDDVYLVRNELLTAPDGLRRIWFTMDSPSQYFPLTYTTFRLERAVFGLDPTGYHLVNLLLHLAAGLLLWRIAAALGLPGGWVAAALFLLHPVQVESVAWITERKNVLSGALALASLLAWLRWERTEGRGGGWWYAASLALFSLALTAKSTVAVLPVLLLILGWWWRRAPDRRRAGALVPFFLAGLAMGLVSLWWEYGHQGPQPEEFVLGPLERTVSAARSLLHAAGKAILPVGLSFSYPRWDPSPGRPANVLALLAAAGAAWVLVRGREAAGRGPAAALLWYLAALFPTLGFFPLYTFLYSFTADHYQYLALAGPALLLGGVAGAALGRPSLRAPTLAGLVVLLAVFSLQGWRRAAVFRDQEALWQDTLRTNPASWLAAANLGRHLAGKGRLEDAEAAFRRALAIRPDIPQAIFGLGTVRARRGDHPGAVPLFREAVRLAPGRWETYLPLAESLEILGEGGEALRLLGLAAAMAPDRPEPPAAAGFLQLRAGRAVDAEGLLRAALGRGPASPDLQAGLGEALARQGRAAEAAAVYRAALALDPAHRGAREGLLLLETLGVPRP